MTREWTKSDDPTIAKRRELLVSKMRAQYHELDPFIRGRGAYHRNGNVSRPLPCPGSSPETDLSSIRPSRDTQIVGNGLVVWNYPSASEEKTEGEWEVRGYETCREECLLKAKQLQEELRASGVQVA